jgi:desumoylating isopeptidase 1
MWRLAVLDSSVGAWCASRVSATNPVLVILKKAASTTHVAADEKRNYALTMLRLLSNSFSNVLLASSLLSNAPSAAEDPSPRTRVTDLLLTLFFSEDGAVRTAAASVAFNMAAYIQKRRVSRLKDGRMNEGSSDEDGDWEMEMISALLEKIRVEDKSEEVGQ